MSYHTFEFYPPSEKGNKPLYYVEFSRWEEKDPLSWTLFKRNFIFSEEEIKKMKEKDPDLAIFISGECHPWNLGGGEVCEYENVVGMETKSFLKFMVDALNEKTEREKKLEA